MWNLLNTIIGKIIREELQLYLTFQDIQANNKLLIKKVNRLKAALYNKNNKQAKSKGLFNKLYNTKEGNFLFLNPTKIQQVRDLKTKHKQAKIDK